MAATPKISVAMPCFNAAATLPAALDSLLAQTDAPPFEVDAVDDGSTDGTWDVLAAYAARDARVRPLRLPRNRGCALATNAAVEAGRAPYVARMDADDIALPGRLAAQAAALDAAPGLGLVSGLVRFGGDAEACPGFAHYIHWLNSLVTPGDIAKNRFVESPLVNPSVMYRRGIYDRLGGARENHGDGGFPEDYDQWLRWLAAGVRMAKVRRDVVVWNDPPGRLTRVDAAYAPAAFARLKAGYLWDWLKARNPRHPEVWAWGAGRESRRRLAPLVARGLTVAAYVDIDPRKIGQRVAGIPVLDREAIPKRPTSPANPANPANPSGASAVSAAPFVLVNVGSHGAREQILEWLAPRGYLPGEDCVAMG